MAHNPPYDEAYLLTRLAGNDAAAFSALFHYHIDAIYTAAFHLIKDSASAEDVCQQVFTALWEKRHDLTEIKSLRSYLYIMARNLILGEIRKTNTQQKYHRYLLHQGPADVPDPEHTFIGTEQKQLIEQAITSLPAKQQQAFRLSREQGLAHKEISRIMGISPATVKEHISNSLAFIRRYLSRFQGHLLPVLLTWLLK